MHASRYCDGRDQPAQVPHYHDQCHMTRMPFYQTCVAPSYCIAKSRLCVIHLTFYTRVIQLLIIRLQVNSCTSVPSDYRNCILFPHNCVITAIPCHATTISLSVDLCKTVFLDCDNTFLRDHGITLQLYPHITSCRFCDNSRLPYYRFLDRMPLRWYDRSPTLQHECTVRLVCWTTLWSAGDVSLFWITREFDDTTRRIAHYDVIRARSCWMTETVPNLDVVQLCFSVIRYHVNTLLLYTFIPLLLYYVCFEMHHGNVYERSYHCLLFSPPVHACFS